MIKVFWMVNLGFNVMKLIVENGCISIANQKMESLQYHYIYKILVTNINVRNAGHM